MTNLPLSFVLLLLLRFCTPAISITFPGDAAALAAFKAAVVPSSILPFSCLSSWNFSASSDPCRTFLCGVSCSADGRITAIVLDSAGYSGYLPAVISNLSQLQTLDLSNNFFHSSIPSSLSSLSKLQSLVLASNYFTGTIPFSLLTNLSSLQTLELSRNSFSGSIPAPLSSLTALAILDFSYNRFTGPIPSSLPPNLVTLALRWNSLTGFLIRSAFTPLRRLEVADLAGNRLNGNVEGWLLKLPKIQQLNLANNSLEKWVVWPDTAGDGGGQELVAVDLGFNQIEGRLPPELADYPSLVAITVSYNKLRGEIPWQYHGEKNGAAFRRLFLAGNYLQGRVPAVFLGGEMAGSFGDNCLEGCPVASEMCSPRQKPGWICKMAYSGAVGQPRGNTMGV
ncbi:LRR receptor-like serine/threonine-protein kinase FLS2 [Dendrobium catenatum]|uniref:LRR receptor-like serine/threonine-protein kinase FLS2 n=1 Tax=Dendrobium catenatum TaxID=906689 RepID=A0A2I0W6N2_9ASPA|nr:LRR receptor-like serine/threonine-protein kinase FLS2 [Dendrobium catenatum]PKU71315.1 LRR receptor-like serine/threonine-protein kinase FLS2 [Dendrobium catenatum]